MKFRIGGSDSNGAMSLTIQVSKFTNSSSSENFSPTRIAAIGFAMISWINFKGCFKTKKFKN